MAHFLNFWTVMEVYTPQSPTGSCINQYLLQDFRSQLSLFFLFQQGISLTMVLGLQKLWNYEMHDSFIRAFFNTSFTTTIVIVKAGIICHFASLVLVRIVWCVISIQVFVSVKRKLCDPNHNFNLSSLLKHSHRFSTFLPFQISKNNK